MGSFSSPADIDGIVEAAKKKNGKTPASKESTQTSRAEEPATSRGGDDRPSGGAGNDILGGAKETTLSGRPRAEAVADAVRAARAAQPPRSLLEPAEPSTNASTTKGGALTLGGSTGTGPTVLERDRPAASGPAVPPSSPPAVERTRQADRTSAAVATLRAYEARQAKAAADAARREMERAAAMTGFVNAAVKNSLGRSASPAPTGGAAESPVDAAARAVRELRARQAEQAKQSMAREKAALQRAARAAGYGRPDTSRPSSSVTGSADAYNRLQRKALNAIKAFDKQVAERQAADAYQRRNLDAINKIRAVDNKIAARQAYEAYQRLQREALNAIKAFDQQVAKKQKGDSVPVVPPQLPPEVLGPLATLALPAITDILARQRVGKSVREQANALEKAIKDALTPGPTPDNMPSPPSLPPPSAPAPAHARARSNADRNAALATAAAIMSALAAYVDTWLGRATGLGIIGPGEWYRPPGTTGKPPEA